MNLVDVRYTDMANPRIEELKGAVTGLIEGARKECTEVIRRDYVKRLRADMELEAGGSDITKAVAILVKDINSNDEHVVGLANDTFSILLRAVIYKPSTFLGTDKSELAALPVRLNGYLNELGMSSIAPALLALQSAALDGLIKPELQDGFRQLNVTGPAAAESHDEDESVSSSSGDDAMEKAEGLLESSSGITLSVKDIKYATGAAVLSYGKEQFGSGFSKGDLKKKVKNVFGVKKIRETTSGYETKLERIFYKDLVDCDDADKKGFLTTDVTKTFDGLIPLKNLILDCYSNQPEFKNV